VLSYHQPQPAETGPYTPKWETAHRWKHLQKSPCDGGIFKKTFLATEGMKEGMSFSPAYHARLFDLNLPFHFAARNF